MRDHLRSGLLTAAHTLRYWKIGMQRTNNLIKVALEFLVIALPMACRSPSSPPPGYDEVSPIRINVIPDPRASVDEVKLFRGEHDILVVGRVENSTMLAFSGGRVLVQLLNAREEVQAEGSGSMKSLLVSPHGSGLFRVEVEYTGPFEICRITVKPDIEGR